MMMIKRNNGERKKKSVLGVGGGKSRKNVCKKYLAQNPTIVLVCPLLISEFVKIGKSAQL